MYNKNNGISQRWWIRYVDSYKEPKKGQLNKQFGLYVQRPFYIVSALSRHRYLDVLGRNLVIKTPNGRNTQIFWFDQRTKTIRNKGVHQYSLNINGNGGSQDVTVQSPNSNWW